MEHKTTSPVTHKKSRNEWRREIKKLRRKRIRQKLAKERDEKIKEEKLMLEKDPIYQTWFKEQEALELLKEQTEKQRHDEEQEQWMKRELLAQKKFQEEKQRLEESEKKKQEKRLAIQKEFEKQQEILKQRAEEKKRLAEESLRKHEVFLKKISEYVENGGEIPPELLEKAETNPGKEPCLFFSKVGSCRFGDNCNRNHSRPGVSKILLLLHFFSHINLEQSKVTEYGNDLILEFDDAELYKDYEVFFDDVVSELEKFGKIQNFRTSQNYEPHLRGNVYIEYSNERDALKAFMNLQGRYYGGKRVNVEFCGIASWKSALCGMLGICLTIWSLSLTKRCPKGRNCNFIHTFENPGNKYNTPISNKSHSERKNISVENSKQNRIKSWNDDDSVSSSRNWRWSETPEIEIGEKLNKDHDKYENRSNHRKRLYGSHSSSRSESSGNEGKKHKTSHDHKKHKKRHRKKSKKHKNKHKHRSSRD